MTYQITDSRAVKALLSARHEIAEARGHDTDASATIIDLHTAIDSAGLTDRQAESIAWVYGVGVDQTAAARIMGISQKNVSAHIEVAAQRIAAVFKRWEHVAVTKSTTKEVAN
ncbi:sigma-70 family RNA polymerase sigma factor [Paenibacillus agricola]|uniref:Sigma-70 family RNA polymerase sigma factor n=1 Tax=Paenibacillus agricola TaxID=2716264 RepID=A0ABX0J5A3_9BACL|nr:sigma-70 family RNA polymerase sigma factor [Paenibacillus agricola]NHN31148.1 sigma-70 family RNA polymerase sigma factor [Paenibacillus agricola]